MATVDFVLFFGATTALNNATGQVASDSLANLAERITNAVKGDKVAEMLKGTADSERLDKAWAQLDTLIVKSTRAGRMEYQYALVAARDGLYPDVRSGVIALKAGDVWKYGTTVDPNTRYAVNTLQALSLQMVPQTSGTAYQVLAQEKIMLIGYAQLHGDLPPGNKIFK